MINNKSKKIITIGAKHIALIAVMTATIEAGKLALSAIPNVEVVTLLCAVYGYVFGPIGVISVSLFVVVETLVWGINTWVLTYIIHWNVICLVFWMLRILKVKNRWLLTLAAVVLVALFGVLSTTIDIIIFSGINGQFFAKWTAMYVRGIWFYVVEIACNAILFPSVFPLLTKFLFKWKEKFFSKGVKPKTQEEKVQNQVE